jgi:hypothetical protein
MTRMRVFWSVYCILVGVALLVKILFRLDFSGWTVAFAILLLESGVFLVTGGFGLRRGRSAQGSGDYFFYSGEIELPASENAPALITAFSNAEIWFTGGMPPVTRVTCLFSSTTIHVPEGYSVRAACSTAFGQIDTPKGSIPGFGDRVFVVSDGLQAQLELHCVFGRINLLD